MASIPKLLAVAAGSAAAGAVYLQLADPSPVMPESAGSLPGWLMAPPNAGLLLTALFGGFAAWWASSRRRLPPKRLHDQLNDDKPVPATPREQEAEIPYVAPGGFFGDPVTGPGEPGGGTWPGEQSEADLESFRNAELQVWQRYIRNGEAAQARGDWAGAQRQFEASLVVGQRLANGDAPPLWCMPLLGAHAHLGELALATRDMAEADRRSLTLIAIAERMAAAEPADLRWRSSVQAAYATRGNVAYAAGNGAEAKRHYQAAYQIAESLAAAEPADDRFQRDLYLSLCNLGSVAKAQGDANEAERQFSRAAAIATALGERYPDDPTYARDTSWIRARLTDLVERRNRPGGIP